MKRVTDSAWGARGYKSRSADSNGPDGGPTDSGTGTRNVGPLDNQDDNRGAELVRDPVGKDLCGM